VPCTSASPQSFPVGEREVRRGVFVHDRPRKTEVEKLDAVPRQENVRGFQVAVYDAADVKGVESAEHLEADRYGVGEWHGATIQARRKRLPVEPLHGDEQLLVGLADLVDLTDVRMIDAGGKASLTPEPLAREGVADGVPTDDF
jgi:hypothetical protein